MRILKINAIITGSIIILLCLIYLLRLPDPIPVYNPQHFGSIKSIAQYRVEEGSIIYEGRTWYDQQGLLDSSYSYGEGGIIYKDHFRYDSKKRLIKKIKGSLDNPENILEYKYSLLGREKSISNQGHPALNCLANITQKKYTLFGELKKIEVYCGEELGFLVTNKRSLLNRRRTEMQYRGQWDIDSIYIFQVWDSTVHHQSKYCLVSKHYNSLEVSEWRKDVLITTWFNNTGNLVYESKVCEEGTEQYMAYNQFGDNISFRVGSTGGDGGYQCYFERDSMNNWIGQRVVYRNGFESVSEREIKYFD